MNEDEIAKITVDKCIKIHSKLGPGLMESVYEEILIYELKKFGLNCQKQVQVPVKYDNIIFKNGFRIDILVEDKVIIELKSVEKIMPVHKKQLLTYLKVIDLKLGLLINFNENLIKDGITRIVNNL